MSDPESDESAPADGRPLRDISGALGGWARRVRDAVSEISESFTLPEAVRAALRAADEHRRAERFDAAVECLRDGLLEHPRQAALWSAWATVRAHARVLTPGGSADEALRVGLDALESRPAGAYLLDAAEQEDDPASTKDALRRARRRLDEEPEPNRAVIEALAMILEGFAEAGAGAPERQRRALEIARTRLDAPAVLGGPRLMSRLRRSAIDAWLAGARPDRARRWLSVGVAIHDEPDAALTARVDAVSGRADLAWNAIRTRADTRGSDRLRVALLADRVEPGLDGLEQIVDFADDSLPRLGALARLARGQQVPEALEELERHAERLRGSSRVQQLREAAYCAMRAGRFDRPALRRLAANHQNEAPELWLWARRAELDGGGTPDPEAWDDQAGDTNPRLRPITEVRGPHGPDEVSPLRDAAQRERTLAAHAHLVTALRLASLGRSASARAAVLEALVEDPDTIGASDLLSRLALGDGGRTLEEMLAHATAVLAEVPAGIREAPEVSLAAAPEALRRVVAARERLARPLTIAIMGEFSSGKSTFVNALLGEELAPMGVLPTTNTINVFRRGASARARVHYRDGRIGTIEAAEVRPFLAGLDDAESSAIRYVEIERGAGGLGDATIVDTPGLNALDPYHERVAREFVDEADAVVWIFSATRGAVASERTVLDELRADGRRVLGVLNKADTLAPAEVVELVRYLKDHVGDVLVDVLPLSAAGALKAGPGSDAGLKGVLDSLERAFLSRARELKAEITRRRLGDALDLALDGLGRAAASLEDDGAARPGDTTAAVASLGDRLHQHVLERADVVSRELLAIGVVEVGKGSAGTTSVLDHEYVATTMTDALLDALRESLAATASEGAPELASALDPLLRPWCAGYIAAWSHEGPDALLGRAAERAKQGESALRVSIEAELRTIADDWRRFAWGLRASAAQGLMRSARRRSARTRATALSLRHAILPSLEALRTRLDP
jgi:GTPase SAR1 family protein